MQPMGSTPWLGLAYELGEALVMYCVSRRATRQVRPGFGSQVGQLKTETVNDALHAVLRIQNAGPKAAFGAISIENGDGLEAAVRHVKQTTKMRHGRPIHNDLLIIWVKVYSNYRC